jgi:Galactoside-binding lectin
MCVNNKHFGAFQHRLNFKKINGIEIKGDVKEVAIDQLFREKYPETPINNIMTSALENDENICVPYSANIPGCFTKNKSIHIVGKVKMLPHSITINLQEKPYFWPHPIIALHINPRFENQGGKHIICRNTWANGKWMKEERTEISSANMSPGKTFEMVIACEFDNYQIKLNGNLFAEYKHRCAGEIVDTLQIFGDIVLKKVWLEEK